MVESIFLSAPVKLGVGFSSLGLPCTQDPFVTCFVCIKVLVAVFTDHIVLEVLPGHFENNRPFFFKNAYEILQYIYI